MARYGRLLAPIALQEGTRDESLSLDREGSSAERDRGPTGHVRAADAERVVEVSAEIEIPTFHEARRSEHSSQSAFASAYPGRQREIVQITLLNLVHFVRFADSAK